MSPRGVIFSKTNLAMGNNVSTNTQQQKRADAPLSLGRRKMSLKAFSLAVPDFEETFQPNGQNFLDLPPAYEGEFQAGKTSDEQNDSSTQDESWHLAFEALSRIADNIEKDSLTLTIRDISLLLKTTKIRVPKDKWEPCLKVATFLKHSNYNFLLDNFLEWCLDQTEKKEFDSFLFQLI